MDVSDVNQTQNSENVDQTTDDAMMELINLLRGLPMADRTSCALGLASRLIEYAAFELAGRQSATDVAHLIDCAARMDIASNMVQSPSCAEFFDWSHRRLQ